MTSSARLKSNPNSRVRIAVAIPSLRQLRHRANVPIFFFRCFQCGREREDLKDFSGAPQSEWINRAGTG